MHQVDVKRIVQAKYKMTQHKLQQNISGQFSNPDISINNVQNIKLKHIIQGWQGGDWGGGSLL